MSKRQQAQEELRELNRTIALNTAGHTAVKVAFPPFAWLAGLQQKWFAHGLKARRQEVLDFLEGRTDEYEKLEAAEYGTDYYFN